MSSLNDCLEYLSYEKNKLNEVYANNASVTEELFLMFNNFIYDDYDGISENKIYRLFLESLKEMISYSFDCAVSKSYLRSYFKILNNKNVVGLLASVMKTKTTDIENIMKRENVTESHAKNYISKVDKKRASYYNYYTSEKWGTIAFNDILLDSTYLGVDGCVSVIEQLVKEKYKL